MVEFSVPIPNTRYIGYTAAGCGLLGICLYSACSSGTLDAKVTQQTVSHVSEQTPPQFHSAISGYDAIHAHGIMQDVFATDSILVSDFYSALQNNPSSSRLLHKLSYMFFRQAQEGNYDSDRARTIVSAVTSGNLTPWGAKYVSACLGKYNEDFEMLFGEY